MLNLRLYKLLLKLGVLETVHIVRVTSYQAKVFALHYPWLIVVEVSGVEL